MIHKNNIKKFIEVSKLNIDRLILSSHFNSHLSIEGTIDKIEKVRNGVLREVKYAEAAIAKTQEQFLKFIDPNTTPKAREKLTISHDKTTYTQSQLNDLNKTLLHLNICVEIFYSYFLKPSILSPQQINDNYDTVIRFIEEVLPCYQTSAFEEIITTEKTNSVSPSCANLSKSMALIFLMPCALPQGKF